eukprot:TRINITY_DN2653_c0_g1_i5.p1 TRINITY_DN2653_c0_g1~~TRINITY_DN2653_c0_g1_i5.p1  ORF type:complete len:1752 (+),score=245.22 TRINITY_DN2653_c0_g1_i5:186-5441(+)
MSSSSSEYAHSKSTSSETISGNETITPVASPMSFSDITKLGYNSLETLDDSHKPSLSLIMNFVVQQNNLVSEFQQCMDDLEVEVNELKEEVLDMTKSIGKLTRSRDRKVRGIVKYKDWVKTLQAEIEMLKLNNNPGLSDSSNSSDSSDLLSLSLNEAKRIEKRSLPTISLTEAFNTIDKCTVGGKTSFENWLLQIEGLRNSYAFSDEHLNQLILHTLRVDTKLMFYKSLVKDSSVTEALKDLKELYEVKENNDYFHKLLTHKFNPNNPSEWFRDYLALIQLCTGGRKISNIKSFFTSVLSDEMNTDLAARTNTLKSTSDIEAWLSSYKTRRNTKPTVKHDSTKSETTVSKHKRHPTFDTVKDRIPPDVLSYRMRKKLCLLCGLNHKVWDCPETEPKNLNVSGSLSTFSLPSTPLPAKDDHHTEISTTSESLPSTSTPLPVKDDKRLKIFTTSESLPSSIINNTFEVNISGFTSLAFYDTGLIGTSLISASLLNRWNIPFEPDDVPIHTVNDIASTALGSVSLHLDFSEVSLDLDFLVVDSIPGFAPIYLGSTWKDLIGDVISNDKLSFWEVCDSGAKLHKAYADNYVFAKDSVLVPPRTVMAVRTFANCDNGLISDLNAPDIDILHDELITDNSTVDHLYIRNNSVMAVHIDKDSVLARCTPVSISESSKDDVFSIEDLDPFLDTSTIDWDNLENMISEKTNHITDSTDRSALANLLLTKFSKLKSSLDYSTECAPDFGYEHHINTGDAAPIKQKMYSIPLHVRDEIYSQINDFLDRGIISYSNSPWAAPIVLVRKSNGKWRFCCDYRKLNKVTIGDSHPIPKIEEIFAQLSGSRIFSSIDLTSGFHQIKLAEEDKEKTAFRSPMGLFEWNVLPFGINNAPVVFQRCMEAIFSAYLYQFVLIYIDDIIIYSNSFDDHLSHIEKVLDICIERNIIINMAKSTFAVSSIDYLGYTISEGHLHMNEEKIQGILDFPQPSNTSQIASFLGMANYYRHFIDGYAKKTLHLTEASNSPKFSWTDDCSREFLSIKEILSNEPVLTLPDLSKMFYLATDWSKHAIGAVLFQKHNNLDRPIAFYSRKTRGSELNYCSYEGELLAIIEAVRRYRVYLLGKRFTLLTDHKTLTWMLSQSLEKSKYGRQLMELQQYEFDVHHIRGTDNIVADALSRAYSESETVSFQDMILQFHNNSPILSGAMGTSKSIKKSNDDYFILLEDFNKANIHKEQLLDSFAGPILEKNAGKGILETESEGFITADGILYHLWTPPNSKGKVYKQVYLPEKFRTMCFIIFHENPWTGGHQGVDRTYWSIRTRFYWQDMLSNISHWIRSCTICQTHNSVVPANGPFIAMDAYHTMDLVSCDIIGPLQETLNNNRFILVLTDYASKFVWTLASPDHTADTVAKFLIDIFLNYGCCTCFVSDQGAEFDANVVSAIFDILNVSSLRSTAYRPQSHGQVERVNRTLQTMLAKYASENTSTWDQFLEYVTSAYNMGPHSAIGVSPFSIMFGRDPKSPVDAVMNSPIDFTIDAREIERKTRKKMARHLADGSEMARRVKERYKKKMTDRYNDSKKPHKFKPGDLVLRKIESPSSLGPKFLNTIYSIESIDMNAATLKDSNGRLLQKKYNVDKLRPYYYDDILEANNNLSKDHFRSIVEDSITEWNNSESDYSNSESNDYSATFPEGEYENLENEYLFETYHPTKGKITSDISKIRRGYAKQGLPEEEFLKDMLQEKKSYQASYERYAGLKFDFSSDDSGGEEI